MLCVAGGGVALLYASKALDAVKEKLENFDQTVGVQILQTALRVPLKTIADNAGRIPFSKGLLSCSSTVNSNWSGCSNLRVLGT